MTAITKEAVLQAIEKSQTVTISDLYRAMGGSSKPSGAFSSKVRELVPDIQARLDAHKGKPTDNPDAPHKPSEPATPATKPAIAEKPTKGKQPREAKSVRKGSKYPRHPQNPFRDGSAYATVFDVLASQKTGISRDKLLPILAQETEKDEKHAAYDLSVLLSAKDSPTGSRHRSCREGFWIKRENQHYTLMFPEHGQNDRNGMPLNA